MSRKRRDEPETVDVLGQPFACPACRHHLFHRGKAQLNTRLATFFKFDWINRRATYLTCARCGYMSWFDED